MLRAASPGDRAEMVTVRCSGVQEGRKGMLPPAADAIPVRTCCCCLWWWWWWCCCLRPILLPRTLQRPIAVVLLLYLLLLLLLLLTVLAPCHAAVFLREADTSLRKLSGCLQMLFSPAAPTPAAGISLLPSLCRCHVGRVLLRMPRVCTVMLVCGSLAPPFPQPQPCSVVPGLLPAAPRLSTDSHLIKPPSPAAGTSMVLRPTWCCSAPLSLSHCRRLSSGVCVLAVLVWTALRTRRALLRAAGTWRTPAGTCVRGKMGRG
jgi:hypothetical protein